MAFTGANTMWEAVVLFFMSIFMGLAFALGGGAIIDVVFTQFAASGVFAVPAEWANYDTYRYLIRMFYALCIAMPIVGAVYLGITIYHKYIIEDDEEEENYIYSGGNV